MPNGRRGKRGISGTGGNLHPTLDKAGCGPGAGGSGQYCQICGAWRGQLGLEPDPFAYIDDLVEVFRAVKRVLRDDGVCFVNLAGCYAGSWGNFGAREGAQRTQSVERWERVAYEREGGFKEKPPTANSDIGFPAKTYLDIPGMFAQAMIQDGWVLRQMFPWVKWQSAMPESVDSRFTTANEMWLMFAKSNEPTFWTHPRKRGVRKQPKPDYVYTHKRTGEEVSYPPVSDRLTGKLWRRRNLWEGHDYFFDLDAVRKPHRPNSIERGKYGWSGVTDDHSGGQRTGSSFARLAAGEVKYDIFLHPNGRARRTSDFYLDSMDTLIEGLQDYLAHVMDVRVNGGMLMGTDGMPLAMLYNPEPTPIAHYAAYAESMMRPLIQAGSSEKGCCPQCGAPWVRVVDYKANYGRREPAHAPRSMPSKVDSSEWQWPTRNHLGWRPTCSCKVRERRPCIVLDPFGGIATTARAARSLGRRGLCVEASEEYCGYAVENLSLTRRPKRKALVDTEDQLGLFGETKEDSDA